MKLLPSTHNHCASLASSLRDCDRQEIALARPGEARIHVVTESMEGSVICETILTDGGRVAGMWGVTPHPIDNTGSIWMLATPAIHEVAFQFLRECPRAIGRAHVHFDTLVCAPWRENKLHLTWLDWCGFTAVELNHPHFLPHVRTHNHRDAHDAGCIGHRGSDAEQCLELGH